MMKTIALITLALALPAAAIELSLEENKAERGNIGYIDMQRLFKTFPDTVRAKENFEELIRQAEDQLNLRKSELLRLRNELSQMRIQREFLAKTPIEVPKPPPKAPEPVKPAAAPKPVAPNPEVERLLRQERVEPTAPPSGSTPKPESVSENEHVKPSAAPSQPETDLTRPSIATLPGFSNVASTQAPTPAAPVKAKDPLVVNIPGVSTAPIVVSPQPAPAPAAAPAVAASTAASGPNPALVELDAKIALKTQELAQRERDFKDQQSTSERNLLDMESRKTEVLLGKIHRAVQDVARREGVSVVVDKTSILYGHDAVDLTEKVMKALKGS